MELHVDHELACIACRWGPTLGYQDASAYYRRFAQLPEYRTCIRLIHDFRNTVLTHRRDEILAEARRPRVPRDIDTPIRVVFLASSDLTFGLSRTIASLRETETVLFRVFRSYDEAAGWLNLPPHEGEIFDRF